MARPVWTGKPFRCGMVAPIWDPGRPAFSVFEISNDEAVARCCLPVQSLKISSVKKKNIEDFNSNMISGALLEMDFVVMLI